MAIILRVLLSLLLAVAICGVVWWSSRHHVIFFPFVLLFGTPLFMLWNGRQRSANGK